MKRLLFVLAPLLITWPAHAELGVNAVAVFYANETYRMVTWDNIADLNRRDRRYVCITVFHVQTAGDFPNAVTFCGAEEMALKRARSVLITRELFLPNVRKVWRFFEDNPVQDTDETWDGAASSLFAAVTLHIQSRAFGGNYDDLTARASLAAVGLRFDPVPSNGNY